MASERDQYKRKTVSFWLIFRKMKEKALEALQNTPNTPEFTRLARIVFSTDPELHAQLEAELTEE